MLHKTKYGIYEYRYIKIVFKKVYYDMLWLTIDYFKKYY